MFSASVIPAPCHRAARIRPGLRAVSPGPAIAGLCIAGLCIAGLAIAGLAEAKAPYERFFPFWKPLDRGRAGLEPDRESPPSLGWNRGGR